ncbi:hypothetical protein [Planomonospora venezuelensis]|uniref:Uncharacterized protein n=1 Tax=Planomonospora venezuelensis TaxID=1999 RepID=A0A841CY81_PLAVE|nr:hypothetical protein [Planomonospora venezuelensis]MBB5960905.1 hypothetical protein [Planomonospora venezuelensis]GIN01141.1 hypothetical protein Pve01_27990 [Planomonospora venezuelensis]
MTTPGDPPQDPPSQDPRPGERPPGGGSGTPGPPPGGGPPPPPGGPSGASVGMALLGVVVYVVVNVLFGFIALGTGSTTGFAVVAALLALLTFGSGVVLVKSGTPLARGMGVGLMIGWGLVTVLSAGFCTGVNPGLYQ